MNVPALGSVSWFEIGSGRPDEVKKFFGELFGWEFRLNTDLEGVDYHAAITPGSDGPTGGIFEHGDTADEYAIFYVLVADIPSVLDKAKDLGATITMEPVVDASGVSFARLKDAAGHHFGVYSMPSQA